MSDIGILHGPRLSPFKAPLGEKRRPCTWSITARLQAPMVDAVEALARKHACNRGDIIRTALTEFLNKFPDATAEHNGPPLTAHQTAREAQINSGTLPRTHSRVTQSQPHRNQPQSNLTDTNNKTSIPQSSATKREGMKDKIPSF